MPSSSTVTASSPRATAAVSTERLGPEADQDQQGEQAAANPGAAGGSSGGRPHHSRARSGERVGEESMKKSIAGLQDADEIKPVEAPARKIGGDEGGEGDDQHGEGEVRRSEDEREADEFRVHRLQDGAGTNPSRSTNRRAWPAG